MRRHSRTCKCYLQLNIFSSLNLRHCGTPFCSITVQARTRTYTFGSIIVNCPANIARFARRITMQITCCAVLCHAVLACTNIFCKAAECAHNATIKRFVFHVSTKLQTYVCTRFWHHRLSLSTQRCRIYTLRRRLRGTQLTLMQRRSRTRTHFLQMATRASNHTSVLI